MTDMKERTEELRKITGDVTYSDPLTSFLYQLMRDELPSGTVEKMVNDVASEAGKDIIFTNGWLAQYANNLAERITNAKQDHLAQSLVMAFNVIPFVAKQDNVTVQEPLETKKSETFESADLSDLEKKVTEAYVKSNGKDIAIQSEGLTTIDEAKEIVAKLKDQGLPQEEIERLQKELDEVRPEVEKINTEQPIDGDGSIDIDLGDLEREIINLDNKEVQEKIIEQICDGKCQTGCCDSVAPDKLPATIASNAESFTSEQIIVEKKELNEFERIVEDLKDIGDDDIPVSC